MIKCPGKYCRVYLGDGISAKPYSSSIVAKSILLDQHENSPCDETDPLGLNNRRFLALDYLMVNFPKMRISNFYKVIKVCDNCKLAYSIIDRRRYKQQLLPALINISMHSDQSLGNLQTKLSTDTKSFLSGIEKYKKRLKAKKNLEYRALKSILLPIGQTRLTSDAKKLLAKYSMSDSEEEDKMPICKDAKTSVNFKTHEVCELAKSIIDKKIMDRRMSRRVAVSKTLPQIRG